MATRTTLFITQTVKYIWKVLYNLHDSLHRQPNSGCLFWRIDLSKAHSYAVCMCQSVSFSQITEKKKREPNILRKRLPPQTPPHLQHQDHTSSKKAIWDMYAEFLCKTRQLWDFRGRCNSDEEMSFQAVLDSLRQDGLYTVYSYASPMIKLGAKDAKYS